MNFRKEEKILLLIAIVIIGVIVGYNAFYIAEPQQEMVVYVDTKEESYIVSSPQNERININTATKEELVSLKGIGDIIADRIISYREENGLFAQTSDIMQVKGIGEGVYEEIESQITV